MERARRFERPTPTLARLCSTPELRPRSRAAMARSFFGRAAYCRGAGRWQAADGAARGRLCSQRRAPLRSGSEAQLQRLQAAAVGVGGGGLAAGLLGQLAAEVVALPGRLHRLGLALEERLVELVALLVPGVVLAAQRLVGLQALLHQVEALQ